MKKPLVKSRIVSLSADMQTYPRVLTAELQDLLDHFPAVALTGPRQCGKTTLAHQLAGLLEKPSLYLDLENAADRRKLTDPGAFLDPLAEYLVILDEVQRVPDLFPQLRGIIDRRRSAGRFLLLGSASPLLLRQSSESLAGRIAHVELSALQLAEVGPAHFSRLWVRGGFPDSFNAATESVSFRWRLEFIRTFLERDIPQLGFRVPAESLHRLWQMLAHHHGGVLNKSQLGQSLDVTHATIGHHLDMLAQTYIIAPVDQSYSIGKNLTVCSPAQLPGPPHDPP